jgi:ceramide glucosyltransferase
VIGVFSNSLAYLILVPALAPLIYYLLAIYSGYSFFRRAKTLVPDRSFAPPVSILKPVRGMDREAFENYASMCELDYPEYEILFAVDDPRDPAIDVIEQIQRTFPHRSVRLIVGIEQLGNCRKTNKLCCLAKEARHDLLVINDSDVRVEPDYLWNVVAPFRDPQVGLVTALFRSYTDGGFAAELDAVGVPTETAANALLAWKFSALDFALGWTMAIPKARLAEIGGFEALVNMHSDDFALGNAVARQGYRIELSRRPVGMVFPDESLSQFMAHELRWSTQLRNLRLTGYLGMFLTFGLAWLLIVAATVPSWSVVAAYFACYVVLRFAVAWSIAVWGLGDVTVKKKPWLVFLRDAVNLGIYFASFFSDTAEWRGIHYRLNGPFMEPIDSAQGNPVVRHV